MSIAESLRQAKESINTPDKWCKHVIDNNEGSICAGQAVYRISTEAYSFFIKFIQDKGFNNPPDWNDRPERSHKEVLAGLEEAAQAAEKEGI